MLFPIYCLLLNEFNPRFYPVFLPFKSGVLYFACRTFFILRVAFLYFACQATNNANKELVVTIETAPNTYKVDYVYLNEWTMYTVEDISGAYVDKYHYELNFLPEMIIPVTFTSND